MLPPGPRFARNFKFQITDYMTSIDLRAIIEPWRKCLYAAFGQAPRLLVRVCWSPSGILENVQAAADSIGDINQSITIHINVVDLDCLLTLGRGWNKKSDFFGPKRVTNVNDSDTGVEITEVDEQIVVLGTGAVLMNVVRTEAAAASAEVALRYRKSRNRDGSGFVSDIDNPNHLICILAPIAHGFFGDD